MRVRDLAFDLSGLGISLRDVPGDVAVLLEPLWARYASPVAASPILEITLREAGRAGPTERTMRKTITSDVAEGRARFVIEEGSGEAGSDGRGTISLASGEALRRLWGLQNLLLALLGWRLSGRGGALLHAAAIVVDGRAFVLVGGEGSGKTTWARAAAASGVPVVSDDLVVVVAAEESLSVLGAPFRDFELPSPGPGRWPLAALLLPRHGPAAALAPAPRLAAAARLEACRLYAAGKTDRLLDRVRVLTLTFAPDASYLDVLRSF